MIAKKLRIPLYFQGFRVQETSILEHKHLLVFFYSDNEQRIAK